MYRVLPLNPIFARNLPARRTYMAPAGKPVFFSGFGEEGGRARTLLLLGSGIVVHVAVRRRRWSRALLVDGTVDGLRYKC